MEVACGIQAKAEAGKLGLQFLFLISPRPRLCSWSVDKHGWELMMARGDSTTVRKMKSIVPDGTFINV